MFNYVLQVFAIQFYVNVGVETQPRLSTIAGEQLINHDVRLESEQQTPMLCTEFLLSRIPYR